ncbi:LysR family transcriptional regulator [Pelagibacterium xiamenense]|uniref:LysR family transcriptional regulator n=1 Tax=Pelagibacterium xiamenense TaxID=2901140 RepID=UPI001E356BEC|nr:LysR family transcriptional regulator [Pelagibacterium xiamenense]MCD7058717.1 LysR family transcriptional regulator [Pelagibacterium xiamenense]
MDWDDLRLFLAVSRLGGLSAARTATGLSAATLGRRITALERRVGVPLFTRLQTGYRMTAAGEELFGVAEEVERAMVAVERWKEGAQSQRAIRVSAGNWTTDFLARHIRSLWRPGEPAIEFVAANARIDIGHRAADIGVRNARPEDTALAGRRIGSVAYALYGAVDLDADAETAVVGLSGDTSTTPSARWLSATHGRRIVLKGNSVYAVRELVAEGAGISVLPCFAGDADPRLKRASELIDALTTEQWLVAHHDERHTPAIRQTLERIAALMTEHAPLIAGARPGFAIAR